MQFLFLRLKSTEVKTSRLLIGKNLPKTNSRIDSIRMRKKRFLGPSIQLKATFAAFRSPLGEAELTSRTVFKDHLQSRSIRFPSQSLYSVRDSSEPKQTVRSSVVLPAFWTHRCLSCLQLTHRSLNKMICALWMEVWYKGLNLKFCALCGAVSPRSLTFVFRGTENSDSVVSLSGHEDMVLFVLNDTFEIEDREPSFA